MLANLLELLTRRERRQALGLAAMMLAGAIAEAAGIGLVFPLIGLLVHPDPLGASPRLQALFAWSGAASLERFVMAAALALIAVYVVKNAWLALLYFTQTRFVGRLEARLGADLVAAYLRAPWLARLERSTVKAFKSLTLGGHYVNGLFLALGDVNGDNVADLVLGSRGTAAPNVKVFSGDELVSSETKTRIARFTPTSDACPNARVAVRDVDGDGELDIVTSSGGLVSAYEGGTGLPPEGGPSLLLSFDPDPIANGGVWVG